eukprot:3409554-Pyramimonas_sp.AAC.1
MGSSAECPSGKVRMRPPHPVQRSVAHMEVHRRPIGKVRMRPPTQYSVSWPYRELHRRLQWRCLHASPHSVHRFMAP